MQRLRSSSLACVLVLLGCSDPRCVDSDRDSYGTDCNRGVDCDDNDPTRNVDCTLPPVDCADTPYARGCPCLFGAQHDCFDGNPANAGVGICAMGFQQCGNGGQWSECLGAVLPAFETCNGIDDDCDGLLDDGVRSPCGGCDDTCVGGVWGESEAPFEPSDQLSVNSRGELTLARADRSADTLWVPNTGENTVSRIDVARALEVARYDSGGSEPTRVAVDYAGDAWIANRAFDGQSTITKIVSNPARCTDRDGNGIDTSTGPGDVKPRGGDDCVALTVDVGGPNAVARAIAVDGYIGVDDAGGRLWVGLQNESRVVELDDQTGAVLRSIDTPDFAPFDAAFDPWGVLWMIDRDGFLGRLVTEDNQLQFEKIDVPLSCWQLDGMAIDPDGRITLSAFYCDRVLLFDPLRGRFEVERDLVSSRGAAASATQSFVVHTYGALSVLGRDPLRLQSTYDLSDDNYEPTETVAVALDGAGDVWTVSTLGGLAGAGVATRFDLSLEAVTAQVPVGRLPYAAGDLTGQALHSVVAPEAVASHVFSGCGGAFATRWLSLHVQWSAGVGSQLGVRVRRAPTIAMLSQVEFSDLGVLSTQGAGLPLSLVDGGFVEVELTLVAGSRLGSPRVTRVGLEWDCGVLD